MNTFNPVKKALEEGKLSLGTWIQAGHPAIAEVLANAGFDWIAADCEHTDIGVDGYSSLARAMYGRGSIPLVRVRENDTLAIRQMLDAGAMGVIVPLINNKEQAKQAVASAKYPPEGVRGFAFCRANNFGIDFDQYAKEANANTLVIVMIESKEAVDNIDEILSVDGVDGVFIGPYDMSGSYGITGQTGHPIIAEACQKVLDACKKAGKAPGLHIVKPTKENIEDAVRKGFTFIALGIDLVFIDSMARENILTAKNSNK